MASPMEPPPFQEAPRCDVCKCSFNTFRRRHHCRSCGRTLCHEHSSDQMALPQFGIYTSVRVCSDCFNNSSRLANDNSPSSYKAIDAVANKVSKLAMEADVDVKADLTVKNAVVTELDCKCGMPLCICEPPTPEPAPMQMQKASNNAQPKSRPKKQSNALQTTDSTPTSMASSSSNAKSSLFFNTSQTHDAGIDKARLHYEKNGEGLREAIKNNDVIAVKRLLNEGVDASYCDKQGSTLLHLAAVFNRTEIAFILMDHGANPECKNAQGETPLECAPTMLQHKMQEKIKQVA